MDFSELDDALDEGAYVPSFSRAPKTANPSRSLNRNSSSKSIESGISTTPLAANNPRSNMLQIHKDTRKEVTTFQDFFNKDQNSTSPKPPAKRETSNDSKKQTWATTKGDPGKQEYDINNILDDDDEPVVSRRGMKPPISKRNDDGRSVASRKNDDNKSIMSKNESKWTIKEQPKTSLNIVPPSQGSFGDIKPPKRDSFPPKQVKQTVSAKVDTNEIKKMFEDQMKVQRDLSDKILKEEQTVHRAEVERLKKNFDQELKRKLQLKDMQLKNTRQNYEVKIISMYQNITDSKQLQSASGQIQEGIRALQRAEEDFNRKSQKLSEQSRSKSSLIRNFQDLSQEKQKSIKQMLNRLQQRQVEFRQEKTRVLKDLQRQRKKIEESEIKVIRKQKQLQDKFNKKERQLSQQLQQKTHKLSQEQSSLRLDRVALQEEKIRYQQQQSEMMLRAKRWQDERSKMIEDMQLEKTKIISKEVELNTRFQSFELKSGDLELKEKELDGRFKLVEMQRKRWSTEKEFKKKTNGDTLVKTSSFASRIQQQVGPSSFEKSLKQLKDEYLRNIGYA